MKLKKGKLYSAGKSLGRKLKSASSKAKKV